MIPSVYQNQSELIENLLRILKIDHFQMDPCFNKGTIHYGRPVNYKSDIEPLSSDVKQRDCRNLHDVSSGSTFSILFDPPFLAGGGKSGRMNKRYGTFKNAENLFRFYEESFSELYRVLAKKGFIVFKCQDFVNGRSQPFAHCEIYSLALSQGLYARDLLILETKNRMRPHNLIEQHHVRKTHCYFWVFEKCKRQNHKKGGSRARGKNG